MTMKTIAEIRLDNLDLLIAEFGTQDRVAEKSGTSPVYLSQIKNKTPDAKTGKLRQMGDPTARKLESGCGKEIGWMDNTHSPAKPITPYDTTPIATTAIAREDNVVQLPHLQYDMWTAAAIDLLQKLDIGQRQAMVARMREYQQYLDPPRVGQAL